MNRMKIWWIPQVPMRPFFVEVKTLTEGKRLLDTLALYDIFQYENNIKPDYCNAGGLTIWMDELDPDENGDKWTDWESEDGDNIDNLSYEEIEAIETQGRGEA